MATEVLSGLGLVAVLLAAVPLARHLIPHQIPDAVAAQPGWVRFIEAFVI